MSASGQASAAMHPGGRGGDFLEAARGPGRTSQRSDVGTRGAAASKGGSPSACRANGLPNWRSTARWRNLTTPAVSVKSGRAARDAASRQCKSARRFLAARAPPGAALQLREAPRRHVVSSAEGAARGASGAPGSHLLLLANSAQLAMGTCRPKAAAAHG
eukprot:6712449-Pyramimonas_sp.AAC.1